MPQIMNPVLGLEALREVGYKSTGTAIAELVDNSIEANAKDIDIFAISKNVLVNNTMSLRVQNIALLDNGDGMTKEVLSECLSLGWGTRLNSKKHTLGRFGFGLKGSSISQARRVEVYSWQNIDWEKEITNNQVNMASLDLDTIEKHKQNELDPVVKVNLPEFVTKFGYKIKKHKSGTLVVWSKLDKLKFKRVAALVNILNKELCRIYRHYLHDGDFGSKRIISIIDFNLDNNASKTLELIPNDPLYLIAPNNLPKLGNEATNELFEKPFEVNIDYEDSSGKKLKSKFEVILSIAKPEMQKENVGNKHYAQNTGISFVRAGREIDFGSFGFITSVDARHRWWGIEIRFNPELDRLFGVNNNKQSVNGVRAFDEAMKKDLFSEEELTYQDKMLIELNKVITENIRSMMKIVMGRGSGLGTSRKTKPVIDIVNEELAKDKRTPTESKEHAASLSTEEKIAERMSFLLKDDTSLDNEELREIAKQTIDYQVDLLTDDWPGNLFLERKVAGNTSIGMINRSTAFYEKFWKKLEEDPDSSGHEALSIVLMALIRAEDELQVVMADKRALSVFRQKWADYIDKLLHTATD
jgi:hypothetical protein